MIRVNPTATAGPVLLLSGGPHAGQSRPEQNRRALAPQRQCYLGRHGVPIITAVYTHTHTHFRVSSDKETCGSTQTPPALNITTTTPEQICRVHSQTACNRCSVQLMHRTWPRTPLVPRISVIPPPLPPSQRDADQQSLFLQKFN